LSRVAGFVLEKLGGVMASLGEVVGAVAGSIFRIAIAIVQWVADQFRALVQWATDKLKGLADLVAAGLDRLKQFLEPLFSLLGEIAGAVVDLLKLPLVIAGRLWRLIPACIRNPFVDFFVNQILKRIPIFKDLLDLLELWTQIQAEVMAIVRQIFVDHDLMGALKATFRLIVKVLKIPLDLAVTVLTKAATAWDAVLAKPLDFIKNILRAMRVGFGSFFINILGHLGYGIQGWLFGALKEQQIQPPASWTDFGAIFRLVAQILGLTQRHIFELIGKRVGPAIAAKLETAWNVLTGVWSWLVEAMKDPPSIGKRVMERLADLGRLVLDAAIGWIMDNVIKAVSKRLLALLDPTGVMAVVNALIAVYSAVKSAIQYAAAILGILNRILDTVLDLTAGVVAGAAKTLEDALHMAMPVIIGFLANYLGLGGIGAKLREIVASIRERVDAAILWLIDQALRVGRAILDSLGLGARPTPPTLTITRPFVANNHPHTLQIVISGTSARTTVASTVVFDEIRLNDWQSRLGTLPDTERAGASAAITRARGHLAEFARLAAVRAATPPPGTAATAAAGSASAGIEAQLNAAADAHAVAQAELFGRFGEDGELAEYFARAAMDPVLSAPAGFTSNDWMTKFGVASGTARRHVEQGVATGKAMIIGSRNRFNLYGLHPVTDSQLIVAAAEEILQTGRTAPELTGTSFPVSSMVTFLQKDRDRGLLPVGRERFAANGAALTRAVLRHFVETGDMASDANGENFFYTSPLPPRRHLPLDWDADNVRWQFYLTGASPSWNSAESDVQARDLDLVDRAVIQSRARPDPSVEAPRWTQLRLGHIVPDEAFDPTRNYRTVPRQVDHDTPLALHWNARQDQTGNNSLWSNRQRVATDTSGLHYTLKEYNLSKQGRGAQYTDRWWVGPNFTGPGDDLHATLSPRTSYSLVPRSR
jgi:hypothetical protein